MKLAFIHHSPFILHPSRAALCAASVISLASAAFAAASPRGVPAGCDAAAMSDAYWAVWNAEEQAKIDADIERNRKADFTVTAGLGTGLPAGAVVEVEQLDHDFRFGAHIFNFDQLGDDEQNAAYKASYGAGGLFNQATVPFYWSTYEPVPGRRRAGGDYEDTAEFWSALGSDRAVQHRFWRRPSPGPVIDFLKAKDVKIHGHVLVWGSAKPYWIYDWYCPEAEKRRIDALGVPRHADFLATPPAGAEGSFGFAAKWKKAWLGAYGATEETSLAADLPVFTREMRRLFKKRIADVAADYGTVADSWDVVNESSIDTARYGRSRTDLPVWFSVYGLMPGDYPLHALLDAKEALPSDTKLVINDFNICEDYLAQVTNLVQEGARIDVVGCQMHLFVTNDCMRLAQGATDVKWVGSPAAVQEKLDLMARAGRPLHISEITICAPGEDARSRQIQAVLARNLYRKWFSHKAVMGITWWNTVDGGGVYGEPAVSGLFNRDMTRKPAYDALDELINGEWKTRTKVKVERRGEGGEDGVVAFRGFCGKYRLSWECATCGRRHARIVHLNADSATATLAPLTALEGDVGEKVTSFVVDGKPVTLAPGERLLDLQKLYPNAVEKGIEGAQEAEVVFSFEIDSARPVTLAYCNDWFGELELNGQPVARALHGPFPNWSSLRLNAKPGRNEVRFRTRSGSGGAWKCGFRLVR